MESDPYKYLLDPEQPARNVAEHFSAHMRMLDEMVAYGTHLIPRCIRSSERTLSDAIVVAGLLKHFVSMLDASVILLRGGAVYACWVHFRSMFEASIYADWILRGEKDLRGRAFYVADLRRELVWARRSTPGTPEHERTQRALRSSGVEMPSSPEIDALGPAAVEGIGKMLASDAFRGLNARFDELRERRRSEPPWYAVTGPANLRQLAEQLAREGEYESFYGLGSEVVHANSFRNQVRMEGKNVIPTPIRHLQEIDGAIRTAATLCLGTYQPILNHYRTEETQNFARKYVEEWRGFFLSIPSVGYNPDTPTRAVI